ncbi:TRAP transporter small permease (plasmid) [Sulfitobacter sp. W027]|uniref:TRAP transporter small permease n=1 Tax=Sulfitobacter sp. W027 TaxID=2867025 RepID=UPI0021A541BC|nr:TRAP transporter small permease [Sulfitobacter sp. W027]UWR35240.1 TRAP transporter small permease [Sulfitobacter sp. W027]
MSRAFLARLARFGVVLGMILVALIASLVVLQVMARNFFDTGLPWADELARFSGIGLVFFAVPCLAGRQVLVSVSMLPDLMQPAVRRWLVLAADLATLAFSALMIWSFAEFLPRAGKFLTPAMRLPNWVYYSLALAGCLLLAVIAGLRVVDAFRKRDPTAPYRDARDVDGLPL